MREGKVPLVWERPRGGRPRALVRAELERNGIASYVDGLVASLLRP
jgi:hypothetical protein